MANTERTREVERAARAAGEMDAGNVDDAEYIAAHPSEFTAAERRRAEEALAEDYRERAEVEARWRTLMGRPHAVEGGDR